MVTPKICKNPEVTEKQAGTVITVDVLELPTNVLFIYKLKVLS
jgi:hypothetical protein